MARKNLILILIGIASIILFYAPVLFLPKNTILLLTKEDGFFESITALFFFFAGTICLFTLFKTKNRNIFLLLFTLAFFFVAGEEISWGQRIFNFRTPETMEVNNTQKEFNFHNLNIFQQPNADSVIDLIITNLLDFNHLVILFWTVYCILIPLANRYSSRLRNLFLRIRLPIVSVWFGVLFFVNHLAHKVLEVSMAGGRIAEIKEAIWGLVMLLMAVYFYFIGKSQEVAQHQQIKP